MKEPIKYPQLKMIVNGVETITYELWDETNGCLLDAWTVGTETTDKYKHKIYEDKEQMKQDLRELGFNVY